jgi:hypothetical protein
MEKQLVMNPSFSDTLTKTMQRLRTQCAAELRAMTLVMLGVGAFALPQVAYAQEVDPEEQDTVVTQGTEKTEDNDGTDPTKPLGSMRIAAEHIDLDGGVSSQEVAFEYTRPVGTGTTLRARIPFAAVSGAGNGDLGLGDISVKVTKVLTRTPKYGVVVSMDVVAPTASRDELGSGKWVLKPNIVYAMFLKGGHIFAPALVHNISIAGDDTRGDVNRTTLDFYFVPRLENKKLFMTIDPALTYNWESEKESAALAVTFGYKTGPMLGGRSQLSIKPSVGIGDNRSFNWGFQLGFQLLGI